MPPKPITVLLATLALAACQQPQAPANQRHIKVRGGEQDQLHKLDAFNLAIALKRAIYDAGYTCKRVTDGGLSASGRTSTCGWRIACTTKEPRATGRYSPGPTGARRCATAATSPPAAFPLV